MAVTTNRTIVNPWTWQDGFGFSQAVDVQSPSRILSLAGQGPVDANGQLVHEGDVAAQIDAAMDNVEAVLAAGGLALADVVRLTVFTTDMDAFFAAYGTFAGRLAAGGCAPASSLVGVSRLALPGMAVELEATAVR
jgi:enamine deaminase RidA (YjgF/YER057c/UK114 family)